MGKDCILDCEITENYEKSNGKERDVESTIHSLLHAALKPGNAGSPHPLTSLLQVWVSLSVKGNPIPLRQ